MNRFIKTEKISYRYPVYEEEQDAQEPADNEYALDDISLEVEKGQFICILGGNGSGKSTLARHLNALLIPDEGTVWIGEMNTKNQAYLWQIRSQVGMVFQNPDNQMIASRIDEEVAFGLENLGVPTSQMRQRVSDALEKVGLARYSQENPLNLSGGQKQRVAVAGVLAMAPSCIVLDESTAMLDPKGRREIMDTVHEINKKLGMTIICITHFMEEAIDADRIFVMHEGKLLMSGTAKDIFSQEDMLHKAGLVPPVICQLATLLREKGMKIPAGVITAQELKEYILSC